MKIDSIEMYQAACVELLLNKRVEEFFADSTVKIMVLHASSDEKSNNLEDFYLIEHLIMLIRETISVSQLKRALKLMIVLDVLMIKYSGT
ncbi:hypothetical protein [Exiguobacterium sp. S22-S28]|uniref:hypothetical protein n=1 Tax=Exiguobacterium sp. S22-S28 TaxID=3342768 RepID=UPI00372D7378